MHATRVACLVHQQCTPPVPAHATYTMQEREHCWHLCVHIHMPTNSAWFPHHHSSWKRTHQTTSCRQLSGPHSRPRHTSRDNKFQMELHTLNINYWFMCSYHNHTDHMIKDACMVKLDGQWTSRIDHTCVVYGHHEAITQTDAKQELAQHNTHTHTHTAPKTHQKRESGLMCVNVMMNHANKNTCFVWNAWTYKQRICVVSSEGSSENEIIGVCEINAKHKQNSSCVQ